MEAYYFMQKSEGRPVPPGFDPPGQTLEQNIVKIEYLILKHTVFESMTYAGSVDK